MSNKHELRIQSCHPRACGPAKLHENESKQTASPSREPSEKKSLHGTLLRDAAAFQQAGEIRKYVEAIKLMLSRDGSNSWEEIEQWSEWALAQADRIDPAIGGRFSKAMQNEELANWFARCHLRTVTSPERPMRDVFFVRGISPMTGGVKATGHAVAKSCQPAWNFRCNYRVSLSDKGLARAGSGYAR